MAAIPERGAWKTYLKDLPAAYTVHLEAVKFVHNLP